MHVADPISTDSDAALSKVAVYRISESGQEVRDDLLAVEEPLEIRLGCEIAGKRAHHNVSVTMRTPGHDQELAVGFLFGESMITSRDQIAGVHSCKGKNVVRVDLRSAVEIDLARLERHCYTTSSCGVCGKAALSAVRVSPQHPTIENWPALASTIIHGLPETLRAAQTVFERTGGLHAAGLFDPSGHLLCLREDVGRHNALDKLIGSQLLAGRLPLTNEVLFVSGRTSFELVQKAAMAGIPILASVGAPSSLAVELAREHGLTLLGFVRDDRFNVYTGADRILRTPVQALPSLPPHGRTPLAVVEFHLDEHFASSRE